ncbi:PH domain-containing protein [Streptomyces vilmorinianum]|uniref:PH domain-containing protein n=1 Tax=Streptomyces vilmorinianum TaxID=3051092 RepID=UPI0010FB9108|nr:PH domain-containing protein [Streptomyces vilmorinianum]
MSDSPLPLAAEEIPPGAAAWRAADAERWREAAPRPWADPLWAFLALLASAVWSIADTPYPVCSTATPCASDWPGLTGAVVQVLTLYWLWQRPGLALLTLAGSTVSLFVDGTLMEPSVPNTALLLAVFYAAATLLHRVDAVRQQRSLALEAAGAARAPMPAPPGHRLSFALAALLLAVSAFAVWQGLRVVSDHEERAARAETTSAVVVKADEDDLTLKVRFEGAAGTHTFDALFPEQHEAGSRVDVLVDGDWMRLAAEPYDTTGWEFLVLLTAVPGLAFLANGAAARRSGPVPVPVPVLRVLVRGDRDEDRTWVYAADDRAGERPVLYIDSLYEEDVYEEDQDEDDLEDEGLEDGPEDEPEELPEPPLREAVLFGTPYTGGPKLALVAAGAEGEPLTECLVSAIHPAPARASLPAAQEPPLVLSADRTSRTVAIALLLVEAGAVWGLFSDGFSWKWAVGALFLVGLVSSAATALSWRVTADSTGLWVRGPWRVRHVPWAEITAVRADHDSIRIRTTGDDDAGLSPVGWSWLERRLGRSPAAVRAAATLRTLLHHPDLRPTVPSTRAQHGMPLGPLLTGATLLWAAAVHFTL